MSRRLWTFPGGLHLPGYKDMSTTTAVQTLPLPPRLILPLQQHIGQPSTPIVEIGQRVKKGEMIARAEGYVSVPLHASSSGTVVAMEELPIPHPSGLNGPCIVIETDGKDEWIERSSAADYASMDPSALRNIVREAGIVGLGGAGFPSFIKLNPGARTAIDTLILNGAECEPFITCDDMLMRERAEEVIAGARIMRHALQARHCVLGLEDNKPEAYAALRQALARAPDDSIELVQVPTRYPAGGEKQLIKVLTGREVPAQGLPLDISVVCHNVATAAAVHRAVERGEPMISRIVTITGSGVAKPQNIQVPLGTPIADLIAHAGGLTVQARDLIIGGPMMGFPLRTEQAPIIKTANCVLAPALDEFAPKGPVRPCIRCGACAEVCPVSLLPQQIYWHSRAKDFDKAQDYNLFDCIECGCCAYVCPSNLPLVQYYRFAKTEIWAQEREKNAADRARERHEFRVERQEREKQEREARLKAKKAAVKVAGAESDEKKKAAIKAAMERAKAKREAGQTTPKNVEELTKEQQKKITEVDARRAKAKEEPAAQDASDGEDKD